MSIDQRADLHRSGERSFDLSEFEFRDASGDEERITFDGVASTVNDPYTVHDMFGDFTETIAKGAFTRSLKDSNADIALFVNHQHKAIPLATRSDGSLKLVADPHLRVTASLNPRRSDVQDVREAVKDGQLRQMSIGFTVPNNRDSWNADFTERTVHELRLLETSIVWEGANGRTVASVRSIDEMIAELPTDISEDELRRAIAALEARIVVEEAPVEPDEADVALFAEQIATMHDLGAKLKAA